MLIYLRIEHFALIELAEVDFKQGLTVITGETGAGKSITIDAIEIIMGQKVDPSIIRGDAKQSTLSAVFDLTHLPQASEWLVENEFMEAGETECTISRVINRQGRHRQSINGQPVPVQSCKTLAPLLLNILGQHQAQHLLRQNDCHAWLDCFAGTQKLATGVKQQYQQWLQTQNQIDAIRNTLNENNARYDLLRYQVEELNQVNLDEKHLEALNQAHQKMSTMDDIQHALRETINLLGEHGEQGILQSFNDITHLLVQHQDKDPQIKSMLELIEQALIPTEEVLANARDFSDSLAFDDAEYQAIENQLAAIHQLARKHRVKEEALPSLKTKINDEFTALDKSDETLLALEANLAQAATVHQKLAKELSHAREQAAKQLTKQVCEQIKQLGMPHAQFKVALQPRDNHMHPHGLEAIQFQIMANPGSPWQPLSKVASGGELSRIHLAMNAEMKNQDNLPTLICDEVDTGIGGQTSHLVGKCLKALGSTQQVISVTHLAPIAAMGDQHLHVHKYTDGDNTFTKITMLEPKPKLEEIARMLGGKDVTKQTRALAKELMGSV